MKKDYIFYIFALIFLLVCFLSGCVSNQFIDDPLETVTTLDLEKYLGQWYEIARFNSNFEKNIYGATAEYSLRDDGRLDVLNSGFKNSLEGLYTSVKAVAWRPDDTIPGVLKVKFFNLFAADYLVFGLDQENYQWALVGNNSRNFLWLLSRTPELPEDTVKMMKEIALNQGYDLTDLYFVPQRMR
ncbi:MAG: lipocalin family protein [Spirochaetia bacterium]|nr:lipocalin family protein [Spirochaetia bacterium]